MNLIVVAAVVVGVVVVLEQAGLPSSLLFETLSLPRKERKKERQKTKRFLVRFRKIQKRKWQTKIFKDSNKI